MALPHGPSRVMLPALAGAIAVIIGFCGPASGQRLSAESTLARPNVTVDLSVLDEMGPQGAPPRGTSRAPVLKRPGASPPAGRRGPLLLKPPRPTPGTMPYGRSAGVKAKKPARMAGRAAPPVPRPRPAPPSRAIAKTTAKRQLAARTSVKAAKAPPAPAKVAKAPPTPAKAANTPPAPAKPLAKAEPPSPRPVRKLARSAAKAPATRQGSSNMAAVVRPPLSLLRSAEKTPATEAKEKEKKSPPRAAAPRDSAESGKKTVKAATKTTEPVMTIASTAPAAPRAGTRPPAPPAAPTPKPVARAVTPPAAPAKAAAPRPVQTAALPSAGTPRTRPRPNNNIRLAFLVDRTTLSGAARKKVEAVASRMRDDRRLRLELMAYAGGNERSASEARRVSLQRALAVRSHLIKTGVRSARINVQVQGDDVEEGPPDRVDLVVSIR